MSGGEYVRKHGAQGSAKVYQGEAEQSGIRCIVACGVCREFEYLDIDREVGMLLNGWTMRYAVFVLLLALVSGYSLQNACAEELNSGSAASPAETGSSSADSPARMKTKAGDKSSSGWLDGVFPSMNNCTPRRFYYDVYKKQSANGIIEKYGYRPYKVDSQLATYKIQEKLYGLNVTEISVPSGSFSVYAITFDVSAWRLLDAIESNTGHKLEIYRANFKEKSGIAYIFPDKNNQSKLVCVTFDGGDR